MSGIPLSTNLRLMQNNIINMTLFDNLKTGNNIIDGIVTTIILTIITYMFQFINEIISDNSKNIFGLFNNLYTIFYNTEYSIEFECLTSTSVNLYNSGINHTGIFSDKTKALLEHIMINNDNNTITSIKECKANESVYRQDCDRTSRGRNLSMFIVCQKSKFLVDNKRKIYAITTFNSEVNESNDKNKSSSNIEKIIIRLFSYKSNVKSISEFVDEITLKYLMNLESNRSNKKFIYTLVNPPTLKNEDDNNINNCWDEVIFSSTRHFSNIFFDEKEKLLEKVKFFIENKEWYSELGIPYSLGIGLHGPPGTGKTSIIKAIANYTNRHIIIISLKLIKTKQQLEKVFFENRYNTNNCQHSITFNNKIIVFEDIDCIGDIVLKRENKMSYEILHQTQDQEQNQTNKKILHSISTNPANATNVNVSSLIESIATTCSMHVNENNITLDDILNLWDGIRETPGRIMFISSNHYNKLDDALIRPGRIDITLELSYASLQIIEEMYNHLFKKNIDINELNKINDKFYTPAEIINIYINEQQNSEKFIKRLQMNAHV